MSEGVTLGSRWKEPPMPDDDIEECVWIVGAMMRDAYETTVLLVLEGDESHVLHIPDTVLVSQYQPLPRPDHLTGGCDG
jgi:hypothetical protein